VHAFALAEATREAAVRRGVTLQGVTRVFVSLYFVHEGSAAFQVKFEQFHDSLIPIMTPFGPMHMVPPWQKGDAVDLVLLFTALCTMVRRVIPVEVSSIRSRQAVVSSKVSISKRLEVSISRCRGAW
jgi:hypothetical protein